MAAADCEKLKGNQIHEIQTKPIRNCVEMEKFGNIRLDC